MDELEQPCKDGSTVWTETTTSFHLNETNGHLEMYGVSRDITERRRSKKLLEEVNEQLRFHVTEIEQLQTELREQAIRDPLTGLYNRRYMQDAFAREFSRAMRENYPISVIMLDMDGLKAVNDMYGHHIGDRAIQTLASCLQTMIRAEDIVCRYGGDEFTVIMSRTGKDDALKRVHEWRIFLAEHPMAIDSENKIEIKFTAGLASFPVHGFTMEEMIHYTDVALYRAKARGRNCTEVFE
jgi:diguanylate cyclase (GGDEF)-like protein